MNAGNALIIAPHADDEVFGMGGTMLKLVRDGWSITTVVVCCGGDFTFEHIGRSVSREERLSELGDVSRFIGVQSVALPFTQDGLMDTVPIRDVIREIERVHDAGRFDRWYVAGPSTHQDHRVVFDAAMSAARIGRRFAPREIYCYELPTYCSHHAPYKFVPNLYECIDGFVDAKIEAAMLYKSQVRTEGPLSPQRLREWAISCGAEFGLNSAERFEIIRCIR